MFDARKLLDALLGAAAQVGQPGQTGQPGPQGSGAAAGPGGAPSGSPPAQQTPLAGLPPQVTEAVQRTTGQSPDQLLQAAKSVVEQHPGLVQAAAVGLAGLLFGSRKAGRGRSSGLARLGGLAVIGGLAYKAWRNAQSGKPLLDVGAAGQAPAAAPGASPGQGAPQGQGGAAPSGSGGAGETRESFHALDVPHGSAFHPVSQTEDDALLYLRTMVAAAAADGHMDAGERERIVRGLTEAGIDPAATRWLDDQMAAPADVEELAAGITSPEKAAQVYAAARIAIDPDTMQEREFLRRLAEALDLDQAMKAQIDDTASGLEV
jgi:uncharacterized membrane protein YebE (DUF533 family)